MSEEPDLADLERRMNGALEVLRHEFGGLRTGRPSPSLLEPLVVNAYGSEMPLNQVGTVSVPDARMLAVQVWDKANVAAVEKAIRQSSLGLNPAVDGQLIRIPVPELSEERRVELKKVAGQYAEQARVAVRNVRRDGMETLKKMEKSGDLSEDDQHLYGEEIQEMTDRVIKGVDDALAAKEKEIMQV
jgi:ribosome recycling factor